MQSNYNNENFERFLRESSDQYRMYPSENAWKKIYSALHTRRRWFGIGLILFLSAGFVTIIMLTNSVPANTLQSPDKNVQLLTPGVKELVESPGPDNSPLTPFTGSYSVKEKPPVVQSLLIPGNLNLTTTTYSIEAGTEPASTDEVSPVTESKKPDYISGTMPASDQAENKLPVYTPVSINISDQATDQDFNWTLNNISFINNDRTKKDLPLFSISSNRPLTIESVINSYTRRNKKLSFQYYFTPTISYRKLSENKSYLRLLNSGATGTSLYNDINNVVTHKPDMGLEVGVAARYAVSKILKIRAGLQFNTSRYDIKAFSYPSEVTTIALNSGGYTADSVSTISNYRNFNGYKSDWLHNFYFQVSAPIGIELKLAGDEKVQFGIGSTIQPTYILGDRAYVLSSNYKNYAEVPWLTRRWNLNTSLEAFVSYSTGKMNWQVGPQVRYQLYSSFVKEYPVKENLFDFGLKIGVSVNK
ncbi:MAG: hypothetical protein JSS70_09230 [Bacteroidetes bacterium]|nr:hypothetical protein [Bacteroidota bacterium]